jgi:hypothetical protein
MTCRAPKEWPLINEIWTRADLFFLIDVVAHGMPFAEVAGFLNRTESEVRERWKLVARPIPPRRRLAWPARRRMAH